MWRFCQNTRMFLAFYLISYLALDTVMRIRPIFSWLELISRAGHNGCVGWLAISRPHCSRYCVTGLSYGARLCLNTRFGLSRPPFSRITCVSVSYFDQSYIFFACRDPTRTVSENQAALDFPDSRVSRSGMTNQGGRDDEAAEGQVGPHRSLNIAVQDSRVVIHQEGLE